MAASQGFSRRQFLCGMGAAPFVPATLPSFHELAAGERKRVKVRDVQVMVIQGASRTRPSSRSRPTRGCTVSPRPTARPASA
jgi:hypothetical protein